MKVVKLLLSVVIIAGLTYGLIIFFKGYETVDNNQVQETFHEQNLNENEVAKNEIVEENYTLPIEIVSPVENEVVNENEVVDEVEEPSINQQVDESNLEQQIVLSTEKPNLKIQEEILVDLNQDGEVEYVVLATDLVESCFVVCVFDSNGELMNFLEKMQESLISGESMIPKISLTDRMELRYNQEYDRNEIYVFSKGNVYLYQINDYFWFNINENWQIMQVEDGVIY